MKWLSRLATGSNAVTMAGTFLIGSVAFLAFWPIQYAWFTGHDDWFIARVAEDIVANKDLGEQLRFLVEPAQGNYVRNLGFLVASWFWRISPMDPGFLHMANVGIHALSALAVARLAWLFCGTRWSALVAGVLFAISPASLAPVVRIHGIYDMICTCLYLWALVAAYEWIQSRSVKHLMCALLLHVLALLANEKGISIPGLVWMLHVAHRRKWEPMAWLATLAPFILVTGAYIGLRMHVFEGQPAEFLWSPPTDATRDPFTLATAIRLLPEVFLVRMPAGLVASPSLTVEQYATVGASFLALIGLLTAILFRRVNWAAVIFATGSSFILMIPVVNASHGVDFQHHLNFSYLPSALFAIWIAALVRAMSPDRWPAVVPTVVLTVSCIVLVPEAQIKCRQVVNNASRSRVFSTQLDEYLESHPEPHTVCLLDEQSDVELATYLFSEHLAHRTPHHFIYGQPGNSMYCVYNAPPDYWSRYRRGEPWRWVELDLRESAEHLPFRILQIESNGNLTSSPHSLPEAPARESNAAGMLDLMQYIQGWESGRRVEIAGTDRRPTVSIIPASRIHIPPPDSAPTSVAASGNFGPAIRGPIPEILEAAHYETIELTYRATTQPPMDSLVMWGKRVDPQDPWDPFHYYGLVPRMPKVKISWDDVDAPLLGRAYHATVPFIPDGQERRLVVCTRNLPAWWNTSLIDHFGLEFIPPLGGKWTRRLDIEILSFRLHGPSNRLVDETQQEPHDDNIDEYSLSAK